MTRRVLALALPELPIELARREAPRLAGRPLVLVTHGVPGTRAAKARQPRRAGTRAGTLRVAAASIEARAAGVRIGMTCAHAMGVLPAVVAREHRPEADDAALLGLARWASVVLSPRVAPDLTRSALLLDAVGLTPVHGDEPTLVARARAGLAALGFSTRAALADTPLAALALALESPARDVVAPPGQTRAALGPLPPRALPLGGAALTALARLGIDTIDGLLRLPRAGLPARLGEEVLLALDRALGVRDDPLECVALPERLFERLETTSECGAGADRLADLAFGLETLAERVARRLDAEGRGARALELTLARDDSRSSRREPPGPVRWSLRLAEPVAGARTLVRVLHRRLERQDLSVPVTALELVITETAPLVARQGELFDQDAGARPASTEDLACLLARLEGVLGARQVLRVDLVPDHRPERAFTVCPASAPKAPSARRASALDAPRPPPGPRPTRLLARPMPVGVLRDDEHAPPRGLRLGGEVIALWRATGPERLETGFWDEAEVRRDYWVLAGEDGRAWWVFRELGTGEWFLHGAFD